MISTNSYYDALLDTVLPNDTGHWSDLTTWDSFNDWFINPVDPLIWLINPYDLGTVKTFNLRITAVARGNVDYYIYTSNTGAFAGEETETIILNGATGVGGFTAQYILIAVKVHGNAGTPLLYGVEYVISESGGNTLAINDVDTSTLSGSSSARTLTLTKAVGTITNIQITPKTVSSYAVDLYVSSSATSNTVIPRIISKGTSPVFALVGIDNQPRDAVVDIVIQYLAEGYMSGNNLLVR
jgi:hypothetical protein